jgi:hypothetical protein
MAPALLTHGRAAPVPHVMRGGKQREMSHARSASSDPRQTLCGESSLWKAALPEKAGKGAFQRPPQAMAIGVIP